MRYRNDLPYLIILLTSFQDFDHGESIEETVPEAWDLQPGDQINWKCAQFQGTAKVLKREGSVCTVKKIS